jgi:hypothetical protein
MRMKKEGACFMFESENTTKCFFSDTQTKKEQCRNVRKAYGDKNEALNERNNKENIM